MKRIVYISTDHIKCQYADGSPPTPIGGNIYTFAGNGDFSISGDGGPAKSAGLAYPYGIAIDSHDNVYYTARENHIVRKINSKTGIITRYAGNETFGFSGDNGPAVDAQINSPRGLAFDSNDNLYIADTGNFRIRKVTPEGNITTFAGNGTNTVSGDGGSLTSAGIRSVGSIVIDSNDDLWFDGVTETGRLRKIADGQISSVNFNMNSSTENRLAFLTIKDDIIYASETGSILWKLNINDLEATKLSGKNGNNSYGDNGPAIDADYSSPSKVGFRDGYILISEQNTHHIRGIKNEIISRYAGIKSQEGGFGGDGGDRLDANFYYPYEMATDSKENLYIADHNNARIRIIGEEPIFENSFRTDWDAGDVISVPFNPDTLPNRDDLVIVMQSDANNQSDLYASNWGAPIDGVKNSPWRFVWTDVSNPNIYQGKRKINARIFTTDGDYLGQYVFPDGKEYIEMNINYSYTDFKVTVSPQPAPFAPENTFFKFTKIPTGTVQAHIYITLKDYNNGKPSLCYIISDFNTGSSSRDVLIALDNGIFGHGELPFGVILYDNSNNKIASYPANLNTGYYNSFPTNPLSDYDTFNRQ